MILTIREGALELVRTWAPLAGLDVDTVTGDEVSSNLRIGESSVEAE